MVAKTPSAVSLKCPVAGCKQAVALARVTPDTDAAVAVEEFRRKQEAARKRKRQAAGEDDDEDA